MKLRSLMSLLALMALGLGNLIADEASSAISPAQARTRLTEGNRRYRSGKLQYHDYSNEMLQDLVKNGQHPFVTVLTCSDSRVPPELLFDLGLGEVFVVRVAGNVADIDEIGSVEYGAEHLGTPLIVVLGHSNCGAVTAVFRQDPVSENISTLVDRIIPAVNRVKASKGPAFTPESLDLAVVENVRQSISDMMQGSSDIRNLVLEGKTMALGAEYHLETGEVEFLDIDVLAIARETGESRADVPHGAATTGPVSLVSISLFAGALVLATLCHLLVFLTRTRIKRLKIRSRLLIGLVVYGSLLVSSGQALAMSRTPSELLLSILALGLVAGFMIWSFIALSSYISQVYRSLKSG